MNTARHSRNQRSGEPDQMSGAHFDGKPTACLLSSSCVASSLGYINIPRSETPCWKHKTHAVFCRRDKMRTTPALALPAGSRTGRLQSRNMVLMFGMKPVCNGYSVSWGRVYSVVYLVIKSVSVIGIAIGGLWRSFEKIVQKKQDYDG